MANISCRNQYSARICRVSGRYSQYNAIPTRAMGNFRSLECGFAIGWIDHRQYYPGGANEFN